MVGASNLYVKVIRESNFISKTIFELVHSRERKDSENVISYILLITCVFYLHCFLSVFFYFLAQENEEGTEEQDDVDDDDDDDDDSDDDETAQGKFENLDR